MMPCKMLIFLSQLSVALSETCEVPPANPDKPRKQPLHFLQLCGYWRTFVWRRAQVTLNIHSTEPGVCEIRGGHGVRPSEVLGPLQTCNI